MAKQPKKKPEKPAADEPRESKLLWALDGLIDAEGPVMVTSWIAIVEYIDHEGMAQLAAASNKMPSWRMTGMIDTGRDMLFEDYDVYDDWDE